MWTYVLVSIQVLYFSMTFVSVALRVSLVQVLPITCNKVGWYLDIWLDCLLVCDVAPPSHIGLFVCGISQITENRVHRILTVEVWLLWAVVLVIVFLVGLDIGHLKSTRSWLSLRIFQSLLTNMSHRGFQAALFRILIGAKRLSSSWTDLSLNAVLVIQEYEIS